MSALAQVVIHSSQFPENVRRDLIESLRSRQVNHKFHYDSLKQTQKWLALHQAYSPSRTDADCAATYDRSFADAAARMSSTQLHLVGLGCGGGEKDTRLLALLQREGRTAWYSPVDVSTAMVLVARRAATRVISEAHCFPLVCDLATTDGLSGILVPKSPAAPPAHAARLITCFGMLPNFEPEVILPRLAELLRPADYLLLSANLAPGPDYDAGIQRVLPLYDNALTRDWLMTFLLDLGFEAEDGRLEFGVEPTTTDRDLKRITARFHLERSRQILVDSARFEFSPGESIQLFFSCRHTPGLVRTQLAAHGLQVLEQWLTNSGEEGVFLVSGEKRKVES
jgi:L-histidine Nalpha-methyltransferase